MMNCRAIALLSFGLLLCSAPTWAEKKQKEIFDVDLTYENAFREALAAVGEIGFTITASDKDSGVISAEAQGAMVKHTLSVVVTKKGDNATSFEVTAMKPGIMSEKGAAKFKKALLERLKKAGAK